MANKDDLVIAINLSSKNLNLFCNGNIVGYVVYRINLKLIRVFTDLIHTLGTLKKGPVTQSYHTCLYGMDKEEVIASYFALHVLPSN